jgi:hypothetical protein
MIERQDRSVVLLRKILRELKELKEMLADERRNFSK